MNLYDMRRRGDANLQISGEIEQFKSRLHGDVWRGLAMKPGSKFRIPDVRQFVAFRAFPASCGWFLAASEGQGLRVCLVRPEDGTVAGEVEITGDFEPVTLPWPQGYCGTVDLEVVRTGDDPRPVFLANHRVLSRQWLVDLAVGTGVEIGPGAQPKILPSGNVRVSYLEQMQPAEWNRLYNTTGRFETRPELWDNYIVGEASDMPVPDGSLDFIFGNHVFEHLANPIGHLRNWRRKLAPGGKVICVIPDLNGTKDAIQERSTLAEWLREDREDIWAPLAHHYVRQYRMPEDNKTIQRMIEQKESIHVHFYDNINTQILLDFAVRELGYDDYVIEHTPNHKDFHFVLFNR